MKSNPYLSFDGQCQAALKFYERCLGGKIVYMMTYAQSPIAEQVPPEWAKRIYHATFSLGDQTLGAADAPPGSYRSPQGLSLTLDLDAPVDADVSENHVFYDVLEVFDVGARPNAWKRSLVASSAQEILQIHPTDGKCYAKAPGSKGFTKPWWKFW